MNPIRRRLLLGLTLGAIVQHPATATAAAGKASPLMLAGVYRPGVPLADYWVSEKYDGVRGYWDGRQLLTRGGEPIAAPAWFTQGWPAEPMDGELWAGHGRFEQAASTVRRQVPQDEAWRAMRFMVFDLPAHGGPFTQRFAAYRELLARLAQPWVLAVPQFKLTSHAALQARMTQTVQGGGEGLMLHRGDSLYRAERNDDLLKVKPHEDADAIVVGHLPGQGRHRGRMGALQVRTPEGVALRLGTGFTDAQRDHPPPLGTWVTYRHRGLTDKGVPRFASFLRVREDLAPETPTAR